MTYRERLEAARRDPAGADYQTLRLAYTRSDEYHPYEHDAEHLEALRAALHANNFPAALEAIEHLLAFNYLDIEAHMAADFAYLQLGQPERSTYHRRFAKGLIDAILATGSGYDFATAFIVISIAEEYLLVSLLRLKPSGQRLMEREGHWFDVLTVQDPASGAQRELYFNVDLPKGWLERSMGGLFAGHDAGSDSPADTPPNLTK